METTGARSTWAGPRLWIVAILLFAAAARFINLEWDQKHFFHPDERAVTYAVGRLSLQPLRLDPDFYNYGHLPIYLTKITTLLVSLVDPHAGSYDGVIVNGRRLSALIGTLTVLLTIILGTRLYSRQAGLLAGFLLAACALHIQNSRFITVDITLTFFVLLALMQMIKLSLEGKPRHYLLAGVCIGLAVATKFSAMPLFLPLGIAALHRYWVERRLTRFLLLTAAAVAMALVAFAAVEPYALVNWERFLRDIREQSDMVRNAGVFPYTTQYMHTPKYLYELGQMILWCMGPALGIAAVCAVFLRVGSTWTERRAEDLVLLSWVIPFFLVTGWFEVKFPRYLLPIYPILILWVADWLTRRQRAGSLVGRVGIPVVVVGTVAVAFAFMSTYTRPHTVVTASEWFYAHVPKGSKVLSQDWDEGFPMPLPGADARAYTIVNFGYYERPDSIPKMQRLSQQLASSDYIVFQTKRLYGALTRAPERFPYSVNYFYELFAGDLGYTLIKEFASRPSLFGIEIPDELADESLTVYDHPKVLVFQNTGRLDAAELFDRITKGLPSRSMTRDDLLLARPAQAVAGEEGADALSGAGAAEPVRSSVLALFYFIVVVQLLGVMVYPILRRWLHGAGTYALAKPFGVLLFAYLSWLWISLDMATFTQGPLLAILLLVVVVGGLLWPRALLGSLPSRAEILASEAIFWGAFFFFLLVRAYNPEIFWGEKPMDFSFLNALNRATSLPPPEPWYAGSALHYSYFGYYVIAALGKVINLHPAITYNLGIALIGGLVAAAAFAAGAAVHGRWGTGVIAAFFAVFIGNAAGFFTWLERSGAWRAYYSWTTGRIGLDQALSDVVTALKGSPLGFDYWWATSRVVEHTINEYPLWSLQFADLHAHLMVMPITLTFLALTIHWVRRRLLTGGAVPTIRSGIPVLLLLSLTLGAIVVTNAWSTPTYVTFFPFVLLTIWISEALQGDLLTFLKGIFTRVLAPTVFVAGAAYVFFLPFWTHFVPPERNFGWYRDGNLVAPQEFIQIFGVYLLVLVPFLLALFARGLRRGDEPLSGWQRGVMAAVAVYVGAVFVAACAQATGIGFLATGVTNRAFLVTLFVLGLTVLTVLPPPARWRIPVALATFAFAVTAGTDLVYVWDRMNTIFKFYLESWFLMAIAAAAAVPAMWRGDLSLGRLRGPWRGALVVFLALAGFTAVTGTIAVIRTDRVPTPEPTLDGMAYLQNTSPHELAAFEWLNRRVAGIPVILEAHGDSYREFTRVSMNTGLPTVLGWAYHVFQRAHTWPYINQRKADIELVYTSDNKEQVAEILERYHVAMVFVGQVERRTYSGGNLERFKEWSDVLTPIYENEAVTIFGVNGRFSGGMPVTTIEDIEVAGGGVAEAPRAQDDPGVLHQPRGVAVGDATIVVADFGNNRMQQFDTDLKYIRHWGRLGELPGQFKEPCSVAVAADGTVFVADTWNQRVQVFAPDGKYVREWSGSFYGPRGIAVDGQGSVFVSDTGNNRIARFSADGTQERVWGKKGDGAGEFLEPMGLTVGADGTVYVCDNGNGRLQMFTRDGQPAGEFPVPGWKSEVFSEPDVTVDAGGTIWVTVPVEKQIRGYDRDGKLLRTITSQSIASVIFEKPMGIDFDPARQGLVVTDLDGRVFRVPLGEGRETADPPEP